jgi:hypothetical protein
MVVAARRLEIVSGVKTTLRLAVGAAIPELPAAPLSAGLEPQPVIKTAKIVISKKKKFLVVICHSPKIESAHIIPQKQKGLS